MLGAQLLHALRLVGAQRGDLALERVFGGRVPRLDLAHQFGMRGLELLPLVRHVLRGRVRRLRKRRHI